MPFDDDSLRSERSWVDSKLAWDPSKEAKNRRKHGVSFWEAATVLSDVLSVTVSDPRFENAVEPRFITIGTSDRGRLLLVVHADRDEIVRIISARKPTKQERTQCEEG